MKFKVPNMNIEEEGYQCAEEFLQNASNKLQMGVEFNKQDFDYTLSIALVKMELERKQREKQEAQNEVN